MPTRETSQNPTCGKKSQARSVATYPLSKLGIPLGVLCVMLPANCMLLTDVQDKRPVPSADLCKGSNRFSICSKLCRELAKTSTRINLLLSQVFPAFSQALKSLQEELGKGPDGAAFDALQRMDIIDFLARSVIFNRATAIHHDNKDVVAGCAALLSLGSYLGGQLYVPDLDRVFPFPPGTLVFIRGAVLPHMILPFYGGPRVSLTHFAHQSVFDYFKIPCSF